LGNIVAWPQRAANVRVAFCSDRQADSCKESVDGEVPPSFVDEDRALPQAETAIEAQATRTGPAKTGATRREWMKAKTRMAAR
jgi:hypothetical protein